MAGTAVGLRRFRPPYLKRYILLRILFLFLVSAEVSISTKFIEDQENLFPIRADREYYDSGTSAAILTVVKDMDELDGSSDSIDIDYTPYIDAPLSTNPDAVFYTTYIEPALLATLEPLDLDFFFTSRPYSRRRFPRLTSHCVVHHN